MNSRHPDKPTVSSVVHSSTLLNVLSQDEVDRLIELSHLAFAEPREVIWLNGSETPFCGLVGTGFVKMVRSNAAGQELAVELMGPGQIFGLMGVIEGSGCPLSARAVCATWYLKMPKAEMLKTYGSNAKLKERLLLRLSGRLRQAYDLMARMASGKVEQRIAAVFLILADSYSRKLDKGFELTVPLTRQDLSELAGTTVETTIRVISRWQKDGLIETDNRKFSILDEEALAEFLKP